MSDKTYRISDIDGSNPRQITLAEFRAEHARKVQVALAKFRADVRADRNISERSRQAALADRTLNP